MAEIVVGFDGSGLRGMRARRGARHRREAGDRVVVVFGYAPPGLWGGEIADHEEAIEELGEKVVMARRRRRPPRTGWRSRSSWSRRRAVDALLDAAERHDARMIVVGSFGEPPLKGMILGSTPNKLLHLSERPVLVVPAE